MGLNTKLFGGKIFKSIMSSYIIICLIILLGTMAGYLYNYRVIEDNIASIAGQRAEITAANLDKEFTQLLSSIENLSKDRALIKTLDKSEKEMGADIADLSDLKDVINENIRRITIKDAYIYYFDTESIYAKSSRYWNSSVSADYIKTLGLSFDEFKKIVDFTGIRGGAIFADGRIWVMQNVYDDHYKKKAVIIFECLMSEIDVAEPSETVTVLTDGTSQVYISRNVSDTLHDELLRIETDSLENEGYYYAGAALTTLPWYAYVGAPKASLFKSIRIFWLIFVIELIGAIALMLLLSFKSTTRLWKPLQELLDVIQEKEDAGFMETFRDVNDKVSKIMSENSLMQKDVTKLEPYMHENRLRRVLDGETSSSSSVIKTFSDFTCVEEGKNWTLVLVRPQNEKQGALLKEKDAIAIDSADKDIMSFTLKNIIDELASTSVSKVYKYGEDYLIFAPLPDDAVTNPYGKPSFVATLDEMRDFYSKTLRQPIYILVGEVYTSFADVRSIYMDLKSELEYRIFWKETGEAPSVWIKESEQTSGEMVDFDDYADTVRIMMNCIEAGNFKEAYQMMDTYISRTFPHGRRYLRQNNYRMYGLAASLTMSITYRMGKADSEFLESLNYEERLMNISSMEELREVSKEIFSSIIEYMEKQEKEGIPAWMDDVQVYIKEHYTDQGLSVSGIADEYGFTVSHLSRTFKSVIGIGLLEYIQKLRVEKAKELLESGSSVNDAAVGSGYLDAKALTRAFKKYEGITPGSYRDSKKG